MRVLVVDDDPGIREALGSLLEDEGYEVSGAADGEEALRAVLASKEPLVVLLDLLLPKLTGEDMLDATLEYFEGKEPMPVSFIIITANQQLLTPHLKMVLQRHHIPVETKPFDTDHLMAEVALAAAHVNSRVTG